MQRTTITTTPRHQLGPTVIITLLYPTIAAHHLAQTQVVNSSVAGWLVSQPQT